jgi:ethanolamine utilization protein EutJ
LACPVITDPAAFLAEVDECFVRRRRPAAEEVVRLGLDLGTASLLLVALGDGGRPLAAARRFAQVVRDGLVVDFDQARRLTAEMKAELEEALDRELAEAAIAVPPGTSERDTATHRYVAAGAGLEVTTVVDEPCAANLVAGLKEGAIVDIGGGTPGVAVLRGGRVVHAFDEATGGAHLTLVLAGHFKISFEEAETLKLDPAKSNQILPLVAPVMQKIGTIIRQGLAGRPAPELCLVGGTAAAAGLGNIVGLETGRRVRVMPHPLLVTPAGIALSAFGAV